MSRLLTARAHLAATTFYVCPDATGGWYGGYEIPPGPYQMAIVGLFGAAGWDGTSGQSPFPRPQTEITTLEQAWTILGITLPPSPPEWKPTYLRLVNPPQGATDFIWDVMRMSQGWGSARTPVGQDSPLPIPNTVPAPNLLLWISSVTVFTPGRGSGSILYTNDPTAVEIADNQQFVSDFNTMQLDSPGIWEFDCASLRLLKLPPEAPALAYTLGIAVNPAGSGELVREPKGTPAGHYTPGTVVTVRAVPVAGYKPVVQWFLDGRERGISPSIEVNMDDYHSVEARFRMIGTVTGSRNWLPLVAVVAGLVFLGQHHGR